MKAEDKTFDDIFAPSSIYKIPYYQRAYVWGKDEIETFFNCLVDVTNAGIQGNEYYMGVILVKDKGANTTNLQSYYDLVDGQQRTTTFVLLYKVMSLVYCDDSIYTDQFTYTTGRGGSKQTYKKFITNHIDEPYLNAILNLQTTNYGKLDENLQIVPSNTVFKTNQIKKIPSIIVAYNLLLELLENAGGNPNTYPIDPDIIVKKIKFVYMLLDQKDEPQTYFDNINSLGIRLSTGELVKNWIFEGIGHGSNNTGISVFEKTWKKAFEDSDFKYWNGYVTNGRRLEVNIDNLFFYIMQVLAYSYPQLKGNSSDQKKYCKKDCVFANIKHFYDNYYSCSSKKGYSDFLNLILKYANFYKNVVVQDVTECDTLNQKNNLTDRYNRISYIISKLKVSTLIPYLIYIQSECDNGNITPNDVIDIIDYLEAYLIRRSLCNVSNDNYNKFFRETLIGNGINTLAALQRELRSNQTSANMPDNNKIIQDGVTLSFESKNETAKSILYLYELELIKKAAHSQGNILKSPDCYNLEHLAPQDQTEWKKAGQQVDIDKIYLLGNMAVITEKTNKTIQNRTWQEKNGGYKNFPGFATCCKQPIVIYHMQNVINQTTWDNAQITKRTKDLINEMINIWTY